MKKKLIAIAALAAVGASYGQVTLSGNLGISWQQAPSILGAANTNGAPLATANGGHVQGLRVNDGEIYLSASEDLGGGWSANARGGMTMRGRGSAVLDRDGTLTVVSPYGSLTAGALRSCGNLMAVGSSGLVNGTNYAANESLNYVPIDKCAMVNVIGVAFPVPMLPGLAASVTYGEFGSAVADSTSTDAGNPTGIAFYDLQPIYKNGPLTIGMNYTSFVGVGTGSSTRVGFSVPNGVVRSRYFAAYDAGFARVGAGLQQKSGGAADQYIASVSAPLTFISPALKIGIDYQARDKQGAFDKSNDGATFQHTADYTSWALSNAREGDSASSAVGVALKYEFSKTLSIDGSYITYSNAGANDRCAATPAAVTTTAHLCTSGTTAAMLDTEYRVRLLKSF